MIGRTNAEIPGSDNVTTVTLVSGTQGATVTATGGGMTKTAVTDSNGQAVFKHLLMGYDWTFTAEGFSKTERIDQLLEAVSLGGINFDLSSYIGYNATTVEVKVGISDGTETGFSEVFLDKTFANDTADTFVIHDLGIAPITSGMGFRVMIYRSKRSSTLYQGLKKNFDPSNPQSGTIVQPTHSAYSGATTAIFDYTAENVTDYRVYAWDD